MTWATEELVCQECDILLDESSGARYRVLQHEGRFLLIMQIGAKKWPERKGIQGLGHLKVEESTGGQEPSAAATAVAESLYKRLECALAEKSQLFEGAKRKAAFDELKKLDKRLSSATFYSAVRKYLEGGCTKQSLAPDWGRSERGMTRAGVEALSLSFSLSQCRIKRDRLLQQGYKPPAKKDHKKNGEPRKRDVPLLPTAFFVDPYARRVFLPYFDKKKAGVTLPKLHKEMLTEVFNTTNAAGESIPVPPWAAPTFKQFEHWYYRYTDYRERSVNAKGERNWNLSARAKLGSLISDAYGAVCDLDATVWNVELVSEDEDAKLIGPAIVFRIRCKSSGQLVGIGIGLECASWMGAASAIASCVEPKVLLSGRYGLIISCRQWEACGLPGTIRADCGETHNRKPTAFINTTSVSLVNLQPARGDLKGGVESDFFVLQTALNGKTPGAIIKEYEDRTQTKWRVQASMTVKDFMGMLIRQELIRMHTPRRDFALPAALTDLGIGSSPAAVWNAGVKYLGGGLKGGYNKSEVELSLMERGKASITEEGLLFKDLLYRSEEHVRIYAYEKARGSRRKTVDVAFDPRLVDKIYVIEGDADRPSKYHPADLRVDRADQKGLLGRCFRECAQIRTQQKLNDLEQAAEQIAEIQRWEREQRALVAAAEARVTQAREDHPISNHALMEGRSEARETEKNRLSPEQAFRPNFQEKGLDPMQIIATKVTSIDSEGPPQVASPRHSDLAGGSTTEPPSSTNKAERMRRRAAAIMGESADVT